MSLWNVETYATQHLMTEYYQRLAQGEERGEALRQVQLEMMRGDTFGHPDFWAAFLPSGEWGGLSNE